MYVPLARTITINGTTYDLSANRSWTIPVPAQVNLLPGTNISITGTYPDLTISNTYSLPIASASVLGGIKVGSGLSIDPGTGVLSATGGGSGTVTNFGAGGLSPLFSTNVTNPTTTPYLSFTLLTAIANRVFASPNGSSGAPSFRQIMWGDIAQQGATASQVVYWNGSSYTVGNNPVNYAPGTGISITGTYPNFTISATGGGGNAVWKVQGGTLDATAINQNIYHTGQVAIGDFSASTSSYKLHVIGNSFYSSTINTNNSVAFNSYNSGATGWLEVFKTNTSNQFLFANSHIKVEQGIPGSIWLDQYPATRLDSYVTAFPNRLLYTDSTGKLLITDKTGFYNDHVAVATTAVQYFTADNTWRKISFSAGSSMLSIAYGSSLTYNTSNYDLRVPANYPGQLLFNLQFQWSTSSGTNGQPIFVVELRRNGTAVGFIPQWGEDYSQKTGKFQSFWRIVGTSTLDEYTVHIRVASGTASMELNKAEVIITNIGKPNV